MTTMPPASTTHTIPVPRTPLVGREGDVASVLAVLRRDDVRLVTLLGPGGVGKTRLALEVAHQSDGFAERAVFVSLAPVREAELVLPAIARAMRVQYKGSRPLADHLADFFAALQAYFADETLSIAQPDSLMAAFNSTAEAPIDDVWNHWFNEANGADDYTRQFYEDLLRQFGQ